MSNSYSISRTKRPRLDNENFEQRSSFSHFFSHNAKLLELRDAMHEFLERVEYDAHEYI